MINSDLAKYTLTIPLNFILVFYIMPICLCISPLGKLLEARLCVCVCFFVCGKAVYFLIRTRNVIIELSLHCNHYLSKRRLDLIICSYNDRCTFPVSHYIL